MRKIYQIAAVTTIAFFAACHQVPTGKEEITNREDFVKQFNLPDTFVPHNFNDTKWKTLAASYRYFTGDIKTNEGVKSMLVVGCKKDIKLNYAIVVNKNLNIGRFGEGMYANKIVIPFENMKPEENKEYNDMSNFNELLKHIPVLKNFTWRNEDQNRIVSTLIMYAHLKTICHADKSQQLYADKPEMKHEEKVQNILKDKAHFTYRNFLRFNQETDLCSEMERIGFRFGKAEDKARGCMAREIFKENEFDFKNKSQTHIYYPFVSYDKAKDGLGKERINCWPAANILTYSVSFTPDSFPQFSRSNIYVSLLDRKLLKF